MMTEFGTVLPIHPNSLHGATQKHSTYKLGLPKTEVLKYSDKTNLLAPPLARQHRIRFYSIFAPHKISSLLKKRQMLIHHRTKAF
jgi:hypothetical protein